MASEKVWLTEKDKQTVHNYIQNLVYKSVQAVFQSRGRGGRHQTISRGAVPGWFNLSITDLPEVSTEARAVLGGVAGAGGDLGAWLRDPACVEVLLRTSDHETLVLEYWSLSVRAPPPGGAGAGPEIKSTSAVYAYVETLLKALLATSRGTPAYRLARRQGAGEDYTVQCRLMRGPPSLISAQEFKNLEVGTVPVPQGTVVLSLSYKPTPQLSASRCSLDISRTVDMRDDHYRPDPRPAPSPRQARPLPAATPQVVADSPRGTPMRPAAPVVPVVGGGSPIGYKGEGFGVVGGCKGDGRAPPGGIEVTRDPCEVVGDPGVARGELSKGGVQCAAVKPKFRAAFAPVTVDDDEIDDLSADLPFSSLLNCPPAFPRQPSPPEQDDGDSERLGQLASSGNGVNQSRGADEFVLLELRAPFAGQEEDLGRFYRECQAAPALSMFEGPGGEEGGEAEGAEEALNSLTEQLARFEAIREGFDEFINSLQEVNSSA